MLVSAIAIATTCLTGNIPPTLSQKNKKYDNAGYKAINLIVLYRNTMLRKDIINNKTV